MGKTELVRHRPGRGAASLHALVPSTSRLPLLVAENGRGDPSDAFGIGDRVDLGDLALGYGETHDGEGPSTHSDDHSGCSVHEHGAQVGSRERADERLPGNGFCALDHLGSGGPPGAKVGSQYDVGVEQRDQSVEVAPRAARKKASTTPR